MDKFKHKEAFCLMYYESRDKKSGFMVWNSRDGVTPFNVFENGIEYHHTHWIMDKIPGPQYIYDVIWKKGQRIFRNISAEEAREFAIRRISAFKGTKYEVVEGTEQYETILSSLIADFGSPGNPIMITLSGDEPVSEVIDILRNIFVGKRFS